MKGLVLWSHLYVDLVFRQVEVQHCYVNVHALSVGPASRGAQLAEVTQHS
jgi:hypothetical protein